MTTHWASGVVLRAANDRTRDHRRHTARLRRDTPRVPQQPEHESAWSLRRVSIGGGAPDIAPSPRLDARGRRSHTTPRCMACAA
jgi:hypothetical protein